MPREKKRARTARTAVRRRWSSGIPDDILAVLYRMVASLRGRVRFAAVCRSWRAAALGAPPTAALPWLLLEPCDCSRRKRLHCPEDGAMVRLRLPRDSRRLIGCHDGSWAISTAPLRIVNLFSGAKVTLPEKLWGVSSESKIVFSKPPTSDDCILATMNEHRGIALCRVDDGPNSVWTGQRCKSRGTLEDITFCNGELYGLTKYKGGIVKFEIGENENGAPVVTAEIHLSCSVPMDDRGEKTSYIFDLRGKLAMAIRAQWSLNHEPFFKVFELVDIHGDGLAVSTDSDKHTWIEVRSLGDHALFLGQTFSKAVPVPADKPGQVERNHIYYSCCLNQNDLVPSGAIRTFSKGCTDQEYYRGDDRKKDISSDDVKRIKSTGYFVKGSSYSSIWILPPDM